MKKRLLAIFITITAIFANAAFTATQTSVKKQSILQDLVFLDTISNEFRPLPKEDVSYMGAPCTGYFYGTRTYKGANIAFNLIVKPKDAIILSQSLPLEQFHFTLEKLFRRETKIGAAYIRLGKESVLEHYYSILESIMSNFAPNSVIQIYYPSQTNFLTREVIAEFSMLIKKYPNDFLYLHRDEMSANLKEEMYGVSFERMFAECRRQPSLRLQTIINNLASKQVKIICHPRDNL